MKIVGILVALTVLAFVTGCKPLGALVLVFLIGCSVFGVIDSIVNGSFDISKQRERQWRDNPERTVADFERWKKAREERSRQRPGYAERQSELDELVRKLGISKEK